MARTIIVNNIGPKGNDGTPGISEDEMMYSTRVDFQDSGNTIYRGEATVGSLNTGAFWRIRRITISSNDQDTVIEWANGNANFINVWDDRLLLSYN